MAVERPKYSVDISEPPFEVRNYAPTIVAVVHVNGSRDDAVSAGFRILADYIFGKNQTQGKIAMTAPVTQSTIPTPAVGVPFDPASAGAGWDVRFTMPAAYTISMLPTPSDARVSLAEVPSRRMATVTFSGFWSDSNLKTHQSQLELFLKKHDLTMKSAPVYAYYDPPWTPWFMRTNEVLVEIAAARRLK